MVVVAACAAAGQGNPGGDDQQHPDAKKADAPNQQQDPDAAIDAQPAGPDAAIMATLSETTDGTTVGSASSVTCGSTTGTSENSWYRAFKLGDFPQVTGGFHVSSVTVGVQEASGAPTVQIKIGSYSGTLTPAPTTLNTAQITPITSANLTIPNTVATAPTTATVPISANIPAGGQFVVEVFLPDLSNTGSYYYLGGNGGGESRPSYIRAPATGCDITVPTTVSSIGFPTSDLMITVTGTH